MNAFCRTLYGLTLPHSLNVETALLPVKAEPAQSTLAGFKLTEEQMTRTEPAQVKYTKRLNIAQCCLCYYQNLLNQLSWFYYKKDTFWGYRSN